MEKFNEINNLNSNDGLEESKITDDSLIDVSKMKIGDILKRENVSPKPYTRVMVFPPEPFKIKENLKENLLVSLPKPFEIKKNKKVDGGPKFLFFNNDGFSSAKKYTGGEPLVNSREDSNEFYNFLAENAFSNSNETKAHKYSRFPESSLMGDTPTFQKVFREDNFLCHDFKVSKNGFIPDMINKLMSTPYQVNVNYLTYILRNYHILAECGIVPPLYFDKKEEVLVLQEWLNYQKKQYFLPDNSDSLPADSERKKIKKIFTGEIISLTSNKRPYQLDKKFLSILLKNNEGALTSLKGVNNSYKRSLEHARFHVNTPLFFTMKLDYRGRVYYKTEFTPLQRSFGRNMLMFTSFTIIKEGSKEEFLFYAFLGQSIKIFPTYGEAFRFVCENKESILDTLKNFEWVTFKDPWTSLSLIQNFELYTQKSAEERVVGVKLFVQIQLDASSSVLQLNSAIIKSRRFAEYVNLLAPIKEENQNLLDFKKKDLNLNDENFIAFVEYLTVSDVYLRPLNSYQKYMQERKDQFLSDLSSNLSKEKKTGKKKKTLELSVELEAICCHLNRSFIKNQLMTKFYNKGPEASERDVYDLLSLHQIKAERDLGKNAETPFLKKDNYDDIDVKMEFLKQRTFNSIDLEIQKYNKSKSSKSTIQEKENEENIGSISDKLKMPDVNDNDFERFEREKYLIADNRLENEKLALELQLAEIVEEKRKVKTLPSKEAEDSPDIKSLKEKIQDIEKRRSDLENQELFRRVKIDGCSEIKSTPLWSRYVYTWIFGKPNETTSLVEFKNLILNLEETFEKKTTPTTSPFASVGEDECINYITKTESLPVIFQYNTSDYSEQISRKEILSLITKKLLEHFEMLQKNCFKKAVSKQIHKVLQSIIQQDFRDVFVVSEFISLLASFLASRNFCFISKVFSQAISSICYFTPVSKDIYYADSQEIEKKKRVKLNFPGTKLDQDKAFTAMSANLIQGYDAEVLREVVTSFQKILPNKGIFLRHDAFVVDCMAFFELQKIYKEALVRTFFRSNVVDSKSSNNSKPRIVFLKKRWGAENTKNTSSKELSSLYIFQILLISNFFSLIKSAENNQIKGFTEGFKTKNNKVQKLTHELKRLRNAHAKFRILLLKFLYEPSCDLIFEILSCAEDNVTIFSCKLDSSAPKNKGKTFQEICQEKIVKQMNSKIPTAKKKVDDWKYGEKRGRKLPKLREDINEWNDLLIKQEDLLIEQKKENLSEENAKNLKKLIKTNTTRLKNLRKDKKDINELNDLQRKQDDLLIKQRKEDLNQGETKKLEKLIKKTKKSLKDLRNAEKYLSDNIDEKTETLSELQKKRDYFSTRKLPEAEIETEMKKLKKEAVKTYEKRKETIKYKKVKITREPKPLLKDILLYYFVIFEKIAQNEKSFQADDLLLLTKALS